MEYKYGTPPTPGEYVCVFENGYRFKYDIVAIDSNGLCESETINGDRFPLKRITQYLGPFPDPLPKPLPLPRRFRCKSPNGIGGVGAMTSEFTGFAEFPDRDIYTFDSVADKDSKGIEITEWIDEEPHD